MFTLTPLTHYQFRHILSSSENWSMRDGSFHLGHFGQNVLNLFNPDLGPGQEWINRTLAFFDSQTPGLNATPTPHDEPEILADDDPRNDLAAMRRAAQRRRIEVDDEDYYADDVDDNHDDGMWVDQQEDARHYVRGATEDPGPPQAPEVQVPRRDIRDELRRNAPLHHTNTPNAREDAHRIAPRSQVNTRVREDIHHSNARRDIREDPRHVVTRNARDATEDPPSPQQIRRRIAPPSRHAARDATEDPASPQAQQIRRRIAPPPQANTRDVREDTQRAPRSQADTRNVREETHRAPPPQANTRDVREDTQRAPRSQADTRNVREETHRAPPLQANTRDVREDTQCAPRSWADTRDAREPRPAEPTLLRYAPRPKPVHLVVRDDLISPEPEESPVRQRRPTINGFLGRVLIEGITDRPWSPGAVMAEQRCREAGEHAATLADPLSPRAAASDDDPLSELPSSPSPPPISKSQQKKRGGTGRENVPPIRRKSSRTRARK